MAQSFRFSVLALASLAGAAMLAGCATTRMTSQWRDPGYSASLHQGSRVLVICQARDEALRRLCEDQWGAQMGVYGVSTVRSYSLSRFPPGETQNPDEIQNAAKASGAVAVVRMQLVLSDFTVVNPGPQMGVGVGGGSGGYRSGGFSFGGIGLSFPIGGATATQGMSSSTTLVDLARNIAVWSGNASTDANADMSEQVSALTKTTVEALKKEGLIQGVS